MKIDKFIETRYDELDGYHLGWDLDIKEKLNKIYEENKDKYNTILKDKIDEAIKMYKVDNYHISQYMSSVLVNDNKYREAIEELLDTKLNEILDRL